mmetsp:Transcript_34267/g.50176  ORF Transcript_34267/g.50176 Transcript_34267/m.50176 type:complete len:128 (-) Transcript_34267:220-603(-)
MDSGEGRDQKDAAGGKDGIEGDGPDRGGEGRDRESGGEASAVQKTRKFEVVSRHSTLPKNSKRHEWDSQALGPFPHSIALKGAAMSAANRVGGEEAQGAFERALHQIQGLPLRESKRSVKGLVVDYK